MCPVILKTFYDFSYREIQSGEEEAVDAAGHPFEMLGSEHIAYTGEPDLHENTSASGPRGPRRTTVPYRTNKYKKVSFKLVPVRVQVRKLQILCWHLYIIKGRQWFRGVECSSGAYLIWLVVLCGMRSARGSSGWARQAARLGDRLANTNRGNRNLPSIQYTSTSCTHKNY
jgi:hypothetical protein